VFARIFNISKTKTTVPEKVHIPDVVDLICPIKYNRIAHRTLTDYPCHKKHKAEEIKIFICIYKNEHPAHRRMKILKELFLTI
jgi:hypothetical protein